MKNKHQNNDDEKIRHKILVCFYFMIVLKLVTVFFNSVSSTPNDTEEYSDRTFSFHRHFFFLRHQAIISGAFFLYRSVLYHFF